MKRPNKSDIALLQARHAYNNAKIMDSYCGDVVVRMHPMAWGLFECTILKAFKERTDLRDWSPELVADDKECSKCSGVGKFPYKPNTPEYDEAYKLFYYFDGVLEADADPYGTELAKLCSSCQATGIVLKQPEKEKV